MRSYLGGTSRLCGSLLAVLLLLGLFVAGAGAEGSEATSRVVAPPRPSFRLFFEVAGPFPGGIGPLQTVDVEKVAGRQIVPGEDITVTVTDLLAVGGAVVPKGHVLLRLPEEPTLLLPADRPLTSHRKGSGPALLGVSLDSTVPFYGPGRYFGSITFAGFSTKVSLELLIHPFEVMMVEPPYMEFVVPGPGEYIPAIPESTALTVATNHEQWNVSLNVPPIPMVPEVSGGALITREYFRVAVTERASPPGGSLVYRAIPASDTNWLLVSGSNPGATVPLGFRVFDIWFRLKSDLAVPAGQYRGPLYFTMGTAD